MTMIGTNVSRESIHKALDKAFEAHVSKLFDQMCDGAFGGNSTGRAGMFDRGLNNAITTYEIASKVLAARTDVV